MEDYTIRAMTLKDLPQVLKIERQSFSTPWSEEMFIQEIKSADSIVLVAEREGRILGYVSVRLLGSGYSEIRDLAVGASYRRQGIGSALLEEALKALYYRGARKVYLEVRESNTTARALYLKAGFRQNGIRRNYYMNPEEDALLMEKDLRPESISVLQGHPQAGGPPQ